MSDIKVSSVDAFLEYLEKERGYSHHSIRNYRTDLYSFCEYMEHNHSEMNDFRRVKKTLIRNYLGQLMEQGLASSTVARHLASLKSFFKYLMRAEEISINPAANIKSPDRKSTRLNSSH